MSLARDRSRRLLDVCDCWTESVRLWRAGLGEPRFLVFRDL
jgi:hypothetical protein